MSQSDTRSNHKCISCSKKIDSRDLASMQCGHPYHYQCLQILFGDKIRRKEYPICCPVPQCTVEPSVYFMSVVLDSHDFSAFLQLEISSAQEFQNFSCPFCKQSFLAYPSSKVHKCLRCYRISCLSCRKSSHPDRPCTLVSPSEVKCLLPVVNKSPLRDGSTLTQEKITREKANSSQSSERIMNYGKNHSEMNSLLETSRKQLFANSSESSASNKNRQVKKGLIFGNQIQFPNARNSAIKKQIDDLNKEFADASDFPSLRSKSPYMPQGMKTRGSSRSKINQLQPQISNMAGINPSGNGDEIKHKQNTSRNRSPLLQMEKQSGQIIENSLIIRKEASQLKLKESLLIQQPISPSPKFSY